MNGLYFAALLNVLLAVATTTAVLLNYREYFKRTAFAAGVGILNRLPASVQSKIKVTAELAGAPSTAPEYSCLVLVCTGLLLAVGRAFNSPSLIILACLSLAVVCVYTIWLFNRASSRTRAVVVALPAQLDLLAMLLSCGLPLMAALQKSAAAGRDNVLRRELKGLIIRIRAGASPDEEMQRLANRYRAREINLFVSALKYARRSGTELAGILKEQARHRRQELFVAAEQQALEAPVKLMLPLITCIFPGALIVLVVVVSGKLMWGL